MPTPANFEQPADRLRRADEYRVPGAAQLALIVRDEAGACVNQSQGEIGLSRPRIAAQQDRQPADRDGSGVDQERLVHRRYYARAGGSGSARR